MHSLLEYKRNDKFTLLDCEICRNFRIFPKISFGKVASKTCLECAPKDITQCKKRMHVLENRCALIRVAQMNCSWGLCWRPGECNLICLQVGTVFSIRILIWQTTLLISNRESDLQLELYLNYCPYVYYHLCVCVRYFCSQIPCIGAILSSISL